MMSCHESNVLIEAIAVGDDVPDAVRAHVASCPQCAARLRLAQRIEQALSSRPVVAAPQGFAITVLARVRRERWRSEQLLDWSFNAFVGIGVAPNVEWLDRSGVAVDDGVLVDAFGAANLPGVYAAGIGCGRLGICVRLRRREPRRLLSARSGRQERCDGSRQRGPHGGDGHAAADPDARGLVVGRAGRRNDWKMAALELTAACTRRSNRAHSSSGPVANASFSPSSVGFTRPRSNGTSSLSLAVAPSSST